MSVSITRATYYYVMVQDRPGEAYKLLTSLESGEVNLLAFNAIPTGPVHTQLVIFPENPDRLLKVAQRAGFALNGPHHALLVRGDDELGALAEIHGRLSDGGVNVYAANGVSDGRGGFGYLIYVRPDEFDRAAKVLQAT